MITHVRKLKAYKHMFGLSLKQDFSTGKDPNLQKTISQTGFFNKINGWRSKYFRPPSTTKEQIITDKTIRRELINDAFQLPIKTLACFILPPAARGPFFAQLMRSSIDLFNHLSIWFVNSVNFGPSSSYPYGLQKMKNILSHSVAMLFAASGVYNLHQSYTLFLAGSEIISHGQGLATTLLYFLGIAIQCVVIYFNIKGTQELKQQETPFFSNWAANIQDPLLKVILTQNILTLTSMIIPLICQGITSWIWPSTIVTASGVLLMGIIQVYLSVHLYIHNVLVLAGDKSIDKKTIDDITSIISKEPFVISVNSIIGVMVDSQHFRLSLDITVDHNTMLDETSELYEDMIQQASNIDDVLSRKQYTLEIANEAHIKALSQVRLCQQMLKKQIQQQFPECQYIQISFRLGEQPVSPYPIFEHLQEDNYRGSSKDPQLTSFLDTIISNSKKKTQKNIINIDQGQHLSNSLSKDAIQRFMLLQEDIRFKMLNDSLIEYTNKLRKK